MNQDKIKEEVADKIMTEIRSGSFNERPRHIDGQCTSSCRRVGCPEEYEYTAHCPKCGDWVKGDEDGLCQNCV